MSTLLLISLHFCPAVHLFYSCSCCLLWWWLVLDIRASSPSTNWVGAHLQSLFWSFFSIFSALVSAQRRMIKGLGNDMMRDFLSVSAGSLVCGLNVIKYQQVECHTSSVACHYYCLLYIIHYLVISRYHFSCTQLPTELNHCSQKQDVGTALMCEYWNITH